MGVDAVLAKPPLTPTTTPDLDAASTAKESAKRLCEILNIHDTEIIERLLARAKGNFVLKSRWIHTLCCMDERITCWHEETNSKLAWSWILHISKMIKTWKNKEDIISFFKSLIKDNQIQKITSHEDCWAAKLFCAELSEYWWVNSLGLVATRLDMLFPWYRNFISEYSLTTEDDIVRAFLEYVAMETSVTHWHIMLNRNSLDCYKHTARSVIINLTSYDIPTTLQRFGVNSWYVIDAWLFLSNSSLLDSVKEAMDQVASEVLISKFIAHKNVWLNNENKMHICFCYNTGNENQKQICMKIIDYINKEISQELRWLYDIKLFPIK